MNIQTCKNCEHFNQHYVKCIMRFTPVDCGRCKLNAKHIKKPSGFVCAHFALLDDSIKKDFRSQATQALLARIAKDIDNILQVLKTN